MTIAVRISNEATGVTARTIRVGTIEYDKNRNVTSREVMQQHIAPGTSALFHIHMLKDLHIEELQP
jgi:MOSC domain-containing protein YiiM